MVRRSIFARGKSRLQISPRLKRAAAKGGGAADADAARPATPPRAAGPVRLVGVAGAIYAATVLAAGLGAVLDWLVGLILPAPSFLLSLLLPVAVLYGLSHDAVHSLGWADAPGLIRASFLVALILSAIAAGSHAAVLPAGEGAKAAGTAMIGLASWLLILLAALDRGPPPRETDRPAQARDHSPVNRG